jgi:predicted DNA-binding protein (MmcQ/YjbR family)
MIEGVIFKCTPVEFDQLTQIDGVTQAPYCAKRMWVRVGDLSALGEKELQQRISASYRLVVAKLPKKIQATLR